MLSETKTDEQFEREFKAMWDAQKLDYPTVTRNEAGEWNYFDVTPDEPWDGRSKSDLQWEGCDLARATLELASRHYEADSCALTLIVAAAHKAMETDPSNMVAPAFIETILDAAIHGRDSI
jgi:hypothetical protein